jgi:hypothetical protein
MVESDHTAIVPGRPETAVSIPDVQEQLDLLMKCSAPRLFFMRLLLGIFLCNGGIGQKGTSSKAVRILFSMTISTQTTERMRVFTGNTKHKEET